jgi:hypothetical protein
MELRFSHFNYKDNLLQQRELFKDCFPETNGEVIQENNHYNWKFHSFPNNITSWEYAAYVDVDMVGYYAALPYKYKIGKNFTTVGMVCDVMTNTNYRGKGIFTKMGTYSTGELASQVPFIIGYPIRKEVIPGHLKVGWQIPFSLPLYMKFIRLDSLFKSRKMGFIVPIANIFIGTYNFIVKTKSVKNLTYKHTTNIDEVSDYNQLVNEWISSFPNVLIKNIEFARWRYGAPERKYNFLSVYDSQGKIIAFVSYRKIVKENIPSYGILDFMVLPGCECHGFILKVLTENAKKDKVEAVMTMMSNNSAKNCKLPANGFFRSPFVFQLIIKNLTNEFSNEELNNEKNWHLMWVDSDDL